MTHSPSSQTNNSSNSTQSWSRLGGLIRYDERKWKRLKRLALDSLPSPHSRRAYETALDHFLGWYHAEARPPISKALVNIYRVELEAAGLSGSTINQRLSAIRKLMWEA